MSLGLRIKGLLKARGISQAELGRRVGLSQSTMNELVNGRSRSSTSLHVIARELRTTPAYLSGETDDPDAEFPVEFVTAEERSWVERLKLLDGPDRDLVLKLVDTLARRASPSPSLHDQQMDFRVG
jgi:transcriptional regulator with XRE-family HTH domain